MSVSLEFENKLWEMADKLRGNIQPSDYKSVILGLIFLKYISDSFEDKYNELLAEGDGFEEDRDAYLEDNIFFVPPSARWEFIKKSAKQSTIGQIIDEAMIAIERENKNLKGVLPKNYARPELDKTKLGELIDLFSFNLGNKAAKAQDILGRVYEYFLGKFGSSEGEFYTPPSIVKLLVGMIEPYKGRVYDPCCGSGGMFVQSQKFVEEHRGRKDDIHIFGQEFTATTWRLCKMNLAIRGIDGNLGERDADTFGNDLHKNLRADFVLANPPFNVSDYTLIQDDARWKYGIPPANNANYAWIEHIISKLSPNGVAGFVLANGSMSTSTKAEAEIRKNIIEAGLVDCIITMPPNLFYNVTIPVCLWFISKKRENRKDKILFIDARKMGYMETRKHREMTDEEIKQIYDTYHNWRDTGATSEKLMVAEKAKLYKIDNYKDEEMGEYQDIQGFCKSASIEEVRSHEYILTPGRYVGIEEVEDDGEPFDEKMAKLTGELAEMFAKSHTLEEEIKRRLGAIGYDF
ncbi:type I restriction-modification system methyltransferase subunit [Desulfitobacterium dichloroeliminans LMG P-21439]|uniref:site-specific DNA-methyltransferase (adenine-specific) n=1 Tax=Desulfitobacterium dichloroeliminans (strain LMG P-21439 / DCA1) TaxID=871963 RepID=L0F5B2_DESDL|nr:class I SAM-dependent DNA methyltransferase [Desulfitobacterium dichloroeliminans]AGA67856.1 type I restriction-modification system methyltransferase subunit [Desulfitobacterium dichloroeliminans LMG P-21439]